MRQYFFHIKILCKFNKINKFKPLKFVTKIFVWIVRGIPLMLQIFIFYYAPGLVFNIPISRNINLFFLQNFGIENMGMIIPVLVAFTINYACYFSEIYRGGIASVPQGQYEACQVLGMTKTQTFFKVILMQVVKHIIPPMSNEIITLVKDTSLARIIAVYEIIWSAQSFIKSDGLIWPLFYTGAFYLIFNGLLTVLFGKIEKKLDYYHN